MHTPVITLVITQVMILVITVITQVITILGADRSNALLRLMTRDGRLHPGLAPVVSGPVVNSEAGHHTPPDELKRMHAIAAGASIPGGSPFL